MDDNQKQKTWEGNTSHITAIPESITQRQKKTDTLEAIIRQIEN